MKKTVEKKPGKTSFKDMLINAKKNLMELLNAIYLGEKTFSFFMNFFVNTVKVFIVSTKKFLDDDCLTRASSIAYTTIISLIPAMTVALTAYTTFKGAAGQKEEFFTAITAFMQEYNLQLNIEPILAAVSQLIDNAKAIGGIGAAVVIFSATAMLRSLEKSLNDIYRVRRHRNIFMKIIYYWAALTLGPIMLIAATAVATQLTETLSSPNYHSGFIQDDRIWVTGSKGTISHSPLDSLKFKNISEKEIDFDNQRVYTFNREEKIFTRVADQRIEPLDLKKTRLVDIVFKGNDGWVISDDGIILNTTDGGEQWRLTRYGRLRFQSIHMIDRQTGFIAGADYLLLKTSDGGASWETVTSGGGFSDFNNITFKNRMGIITGTRATILLTGDYGATWKTITVKEAVNNERHFSINNAFILDNYDIIIVGDNGTILHSTDGAATWKQINFRQNGYFTIFFFNKNEGVIGGRKGNMIFTDDGGTNWYQKSLPTYRVNKILYSDGILWTVGDTGMVMASNDRGESWSGVEGRSFIGYAVNFFAPFIFIWLLFLLAYMSLPNTRVPFRPAAIGAAFTGAVWVIFILLFIFYTKAFATGTFAIYGALVAIPLFLLMVYTSALIILYGAEVSYTLMHPESYTTLKKVFSNKDELNIFNGINILLTVYGNFEKDLGPTSIQNLLKSSSQDDLQTDHFIKIFMQHKLLAQDTDGSFFPTKSSEKIKIAAVIDVIHSISFSLPPGAKRSPLKIWLVELFEKMSKSRSHILGDVTLKELIKKQYS